jgi:FkbM family methyltransferase
MTDVLKFCDISGNIIDLSLSENYKQHAFAEHSCVSAIINQFNRDFYYFLKRQEELNIIDLGANIGLFSIYASPVAEKIFAVEPTPSHFELLNELVKLTEKQNIETYQIAIGLENGESDFHIHERNSTMNSFVQHKTDPHSGKTVRVKTLTLNSFIDSLNLDAKIGFVKMDIEGFENQVVFESSFEEAVTKIDAMYVEVHDYEDCGKMNYNFNRIKDQFKSWGRTVEKLQFDGMLVY